MKILGLSAFYHDSAAALVIDGEIIAAVQEERFTRVKHDDCFPVNSIKYCLKEANLEIDDLDAVVFYDKPLLTFERILETYYSLAPKGIRSFLKFIPVWAKEKLFLKKSIRKGLLKVGRYKKEGLNLLFSEHHLSHSASCFYPSNFEEAAILTVDGVGEWATASISHGKGKSIKVLKELHFPDSLGLLYSSFTYFLGFKVNSGEYKLMGLAPYGNTGSGKVDLYKKIITTKLIKIYPDGSIRLDQSYFNYTVGLTMVKHKKWEALFGFTKRDAESELKQVHCDLALAIQQVCEEIVFLMAKEAKRLTKCDYLCMAGGVALNCVSNGKLWKKGLFKEIYIQPASGDSGGALGAALAIHHIYFNKDRHIEKGTYDKMHGGFLGPSYGSNEVKETLDQFDAVYNELENIDEVVESTAAYLSQNKIVGWFQGRMEYGPRALGGRSILGNASNSETQYNMNLKIKYRESFRPFAPVVLKEDVEKYFEFNQDSPYMLQVHPVQKKIRLHLPENYDSLSMKEKLKIKKSHYPAITHVDLSSRIQTVNKAENPNAYKLLQEYKRQTGDGILVNTSFNVRGEPIVCNPLDAYQCFMRTDMDVLVIGNCIFEKQKQPKWSDSSDWRKDYKLD